MRPAAARTPAPMPRLSAEGEMWPLCRRARTPALPAWRKTRVVCWSGCARPVSRMRPVLGLKSSCDMTSPEHSSEFEVEMPRGVKNSRRSCCKRLNRGAHFDCRLCACFSGGVSASAIAGIGAWTTPVFYLDVQISVLAGSKSHRTQLPKTRSVRSTWNPFSRSRRSGSETAEHGGLGSTGGRQSVSRRLSSG